MHLPLTSPPQWLCVAGPFQDVIVSTRCRLARNIVGFPFTWRASELQLRDSTRQILDAATRSSDLLDRSRALHRPDLSDTQTHALLDWRLVSKEWVDAGEHRWLIPDFAGHSSLTTQEEDHLRLQCILPGFQPNEARANVEQMEIALAATLPFSHSSTLGFLTTSLTNVGTGMRLSVLAHLPGLAAEGILPNAIHGARGMGCSVRGIFGEGSAAEGAFYQISNAYTYGVSLEETVPRLLQVVRYLVAAERGARNREFGKPEGERNLKDAVSESLELLSREDASPSRLLALVSVLRLGASQGVLAADLTDASEWLAIAGAAGVAGGPGNIERSRFEAVRRTASLRQVLRVLLK